MTHTDTDQPVESLMVTWLDVRAVRYCNSLIMRDAHDLNAHILQAQHGLRQCQEYVFGLVTATVVDEAGHTDIHLVRVIARDL